MTKTLKRRALGLFEFSKALFPALRKLTNQQMRWFALKASGQVVVGAHTYGLPNILYWDNKTKLTIGKFCSIAEGAVFILGGNHRLDWVSTYPFSSFRRDWPSAIGMESVVATKGDITVGNDVWIGHNAMILSGVSIGNGAVIGAGSVVSKSVEDFAVVAGNPAQVIKFRFDDDTRSQISQLAWWDWPEDKISLHVLELMNNPENFLSKKNT
jgi:chloramphenicol O-acetyltransferase type B